MGSRRGIWSGRKKWKEGERGKSKVRMKKFNERDKNQR